MSRRLVEVGLVAGGVAVGLALGIGLSAGPSARPRDWIDALDVALRVMTVGVFVAGLVGTFAVLTSLQSSVYSQMYGRFQTMLLKLAEHPEWYDRLRSDVYLPNDDEPTAAAAPSHRFLANSMVNLYEEAYLLSEAKVLGIIPTMPFDYWQSMLGSMRAAFRLPYVRTHWELRRAAYSPRFNRFVRESVLPSEHETPR